MQIKLLFQKKQLTRLLDHVHEVQTTYRADLDAKLRPRHFCKFFHAMREQGKRSAVGAATST